jgi:hypothetical protein
MGRLVGAGEVLTVGFELGLLVLGPLVGLIVGVPVGLKRARMRGWIQAHHTEKISPHNRNLPWCGMICKA